MAYKSYGVDFFAGFVVGALVGAAAALLFAPQSGEETRTLIRDKGIELKEQADDLTYDARQRAEALQVQAKERADSLQTQVKKAVEDGKGAAAGKKEDMLAEVDAEEQVEVIVQE